MTNWNLIDEHTRDGFTIKTYTSPETDAPDDHYTTPEVLKAIRDGNLAWFQVKVEASKLGYVLGETWLGGCCYPSEEAFLGGQNFWPDMCLDAVTDAKQTLKDLVEV